MYVLNVAKHVRQSILQRFCRLPSHAVALAALPPAPSPFDVFLGEYLHISPMRLSV